MKIQVVSNHSTQRLDGATIGNQFYAMYPYIGNISLDILIYRHHFIEILYCVIRVILRTVRLIMYKCSTILRPVREFFTR
jgi:hypothetical protein